MTDFCECDDIEPPPFMAKKDAKEGGRKKKDPDRFQNVKKEGLEISDDAWKKIQGDKTQRVKKKSKLAKLEEDMREQEKVTENQHSYQWYLDDDYLAELQMRLDTCYTLKPLDPMLMKVYQCYNENIEEPMKCSGLVTDLKMKVAEDKSRYVEKLKKARIIDIGAKQGGAGAPPKK